jgi:hypothetical protein
MDEVPVNVKYLLDAMRARSHQDLLAEVFIIAPVSIFFQIVWFFVGLVTETAAQSWLYALFSS